MIDVILFNVTQFKSEYKPFVYKQWIFMYTETSFTLQFHAWIHFNSENTFFLDKFPFSILLSISNYKNKRIEKIIHNYTYKKIYPKNYFWNYLIFKNIFFWIFFG